MRAFNQFGGLIICKLIENAVAFSIRVLHLQLSLEIHFHHDLSTLRLNIIDKAIKKSGFLQYSQQSTSQSMESNQNNSISSINAIRSSIYVQTNLRKKMQKTAKIVGFCSLLVISLVI